MDYKTSTTMQKLILLLLCTALSYTCTAQTLVFNMILFGDSAGVSTVSKTHDANGVDNYSLDSRIRAKILWITRENHTHYESRYKDGKLISASYYEINNGKKDKWSNIQYDGKEYQAESYHGKKSFKEVPTFSVGSMYCDTYNPNRKRFFLEMEAEFIDLKFPEPNTIEFKSSDGNRNVFHFKNGQITDAEFHTTIATVYLKRIK
jgi:hypothetical protein